MFPYEYNGALVDGDLEVIGLPEYSYAVFPLKMCVVEGKIILLYNNLVIKWFETGGGDIR